MPSQSPALPKKTRQPSQSLADGGVVDYIKSALGFKPSPPPAPSVTPSMLGSGQAAKAADSLANRQKRIDEASNYADGGVVDRIKTALGFNPSPQQAQPVQQPPKQPAPIDTSVLGNGMAQGAATALKGGQRRIDDAIEKASGYADGGMIRGKGTGTSDDIQRNMPDGTYIMPADSTKTIGAKALQKMGKNTPVHVSNGEYELPPEQVHAIGVQVLDAVKDKTHTPVRQPKGFHAGNFFSDGGVKDDPFKNKPGQVGGGLDPFAPINNSQIPKGTPTPEPAPSAAPMSAEVKPASQPTAAPANSPGVMDAVKDAVKDAANSALRSSVIGAPMAGGSDTRNVLSSVGDDISAAKGAGQTIGATLRGTAVVPAIAADATSALYDTKIKPAMGFVSDVYKGATGNFGDAPASQAKPSGVTSPPSTTEAPSGAETSKSDAAPAAAPPSTPTTQNPTSSDVARPGDAAKPGDVVKTTDKDGNVSYSGHNIGENFTINGKAPSRGGYMVVPGGGFGGTRAPVSDTGFVPGSARSGGGRVTLIRDSATEKRNAEVDRQQLLSSLNKRGMTSSQRNAMVSLMNNENDNATQLQRQDMSDVAAMNRQGASDDAALTRTAITEGGSNARFGASNALAQQEFDLESETKGYTNRAAARQEQLYEKYDAAKTPEERAAIAQSIRDLSGKADNPKDYLVDVGGGQSFDEKAGMVLNNPKRWVDSRNGKELGAQAQSTGADAGALKWLKENPNDPRAAQIKKSLGL
jgi:hypothetical protein